MDVGENESALSAEGEVYVPFNLINGSFELPSLAVIDDEVMVDASGDWVTSVTNTA